MKRWAIVICAALWLIGCNSSGPGSGNVIQDKLQGTWKSVSATCSGASDSEYTSAIAAGAAEFLIFDGSTLTDKLQGSTCTQASAFSFSINAGAGTIAATEVGASTCTPANCAVSEFPTYGVSGNCTSTGGSATIDFTLSQDQTLKFTFPEADCNSTIGTLIVTYQKQ